MGLHPDGRFFLLSSAGYIQKTYGDTESETHDAELMIYINKSRQAIGGDQGWETMLNQRISCPEFGKCRKRKNNKYRVHCMSYVCLDYMERHTLLYGNNLVGWFALMFYNVYIFSLLPLKVLHCNRFCLLRPVGLHIL